MERKKETGEKESERAGKRGRGRLFLSPLPPTDTDSVTMETFSSLNLISLSTPSFASLSIIHKCLYRLWTVIAILPEMGRKRGKETEVEGDKEK